MTAAWTLPLTTGRAPISANRRIHWGQRAAEQKYWRHITWLMCRAERIPALDFVDLVLSITPPDRRRRDSDNYAACLKAAKDGVVDAGVIPDDTPEYCTWQITLTPPGDQWAVALTITEGTRK